MRIDLEARKISITVVRARVPNREAAHRTLRRHHHLGIHDLDQILILNCLVNVSIIKQNRNPNAIKSQESRLDPGQGLDHHREDKVRAGMIDTTEIGTAPLHLIHPVENAAPTIADD